MIFDSDGLMKVAPVGPWKVLEDDEDGTYEVFDVSMAKLYMGIPFCNVWIFCAQKLRVGRTYQGKLVDDENQNCPVLILDTDKRNR